jgi:hypothetical protein
MRNPESASLQIPARAGHERESSLFRLGEDHGRCEELGWAAPMDPPAQGERNVHTVHRGTGEVRLGASMDGSGCRPGCLAAATPISGSPVKWRSAERKSEKVVVAMIGVDNTTRRSEGPLARCATAQPRPRGGRGASRVAGASGQPWWRQGNAAGRLPGGKPCEVAPHARFGKGEQETGRCYRACSLLHCPRGVTSRPR